MCKLTESLPYLFIHVSQVMVTFVFFRIALSVISLQQNERKERGTLSICWSMHDNIKLGPKSHPNTKKLAGHSQPCGYSSTRQMLRISFFWPDWNSYVRLGVFHTIFSTKRSHYCFFLEISVIKFLIIRFLTSVAYCTINPILLQFEAQAVRARDVWFTSESRCRYRDL